MSGAGRRHALVGLACLVLTALVAACGGPDNQQLYDAVQNHAAEEVTIQATVTRVLADESGGPDGPHERFDVDAGQGITCEIDHNLTLAPRAPVSPGTVVVIKGQYEPDPQGCVIHYTHHSTSAHHESGYIEVAGQQYS